MNKSIEAVLANTDLTQHKTLNDIVYEAFFKTIVGGSIPAGERINEKEYSEKMHISRTPIRYAMKLLEHDGLVEYVPKFGMVVKQITCDDALEIFAIRKSLDTLATITAMKKMSEADFDELDQLLALTEKASAEGDSDRVTELFHTFHKFISDKSGMIRLKEITTRMQEYLVRFRCVSLRDGVRCEIAIGEHRQMYEAMRNKDEDKLREIIDSHLDGALQFTLQTMKREEGE